MPTNDAHATGTVERDAAFTLPPRLVLLGLIVKYSLMIGYGVTAILAGIPTFELVAGPLLELVWPSSIALLASLALVGTLRSWYTLRTTFELQVTRALVAVFTAYSGALIFRFISGGAESSGSAALSFLPLILLVFPTLRILALGVQKGDHR